MSKRKIVVNDIIYEWCYGGQGAVIWDAERKQHHAIICDGMIVPSIIERWIRIHILKEDLT